MEPQTESSKPIFSLPTVIFLAFLLSLGFLSFIFQKEEVAKQVVTTNKTEDWKTYKNEEYGFEFKYPSGYNLNENYPINLTKYSLNGEGLQVIVFRGDEVGRIITFSTDTNCDWAIYMGVNCDVSRVKNPRNDLYFEETMISNRKAIKVVSCNIGCALTIFLKNNDSLFNIGVEIDKYIEFKDGKPKILENEADKILSTFKFTK